MVKGNLCYQHSLHLLQEQTSVIVLQIAVEINEFSDIVQIIVAFRRRQLLVFPDSNSLLFLISLVNQLDETFSGNGRCLA